MLPVKLTGVVHQQRHPKGKEREGINRYCLHSDLLLTLLSLTSIPGHTNVMATSPVKLLKVKCLPSSSLPLQINIQLIIIG